MATDILTMKKEVADQYMEELKDELNIFEKTLMWPLETGLKNTMLEDIGHIDSFNQLESVNRWKYIFSLNKSLAKSVLDFIKEKQELLALAQTREDLESLKKGILPGAETDENPEEPENSEEQDEQEEVEPETGDEDTKIVTENEEEGNEDGQESNDEEESDNGADSDTHDLLDTQGPSMESAVAIGGAGVTLEVSAQVALRSPKLRQAEAIIDSGQTQQYFRNVAGEIRDKMNNPKYGRLTKYKMKKMAQGLEDAGSAINGESLDALKVWKKVGKNKLTPSALSALGVNPKGLTQLQTLVASDVLDGLTDTKFQQLKKSGALKQFLIAQGVTDITDDAVRLLRNADNLSDFKNMARVISQAKQLRTVMRVFRGGIITDLAAMGLDVWFYKQDLAAAHRITNDARRENAIKKAQYNLGVGLGVGTAGIGLIITAFTVAGPPGWIIGAGAVGLITAYQTLISGADKMWFNLVDFYAQDMDDYITQYHTEVKSAIAQLRWSADGKKMSINEKFHDWWSNESDEDLLSMKSILLDEAWKALVYLDEPTDEIIQKKMQIHQLQMLLEDGNLNEEEKEAFTNAISELQEAMKQENKKIMPRVEQRMEYIIKYQDDEQYAGFENIPNLVADSATYVRMKATYDPAYRYEDDSCYITKKCTTLQEYKNAYKEQLQQDNPDFFERLEEVYAQNPTQLLGIFSVAKRYVENIEDIDRDDVPKDEKQELQEDFNNFSIIQERTDFLKHFLDYVQLGRTTEGGGRHLSDEVFGLRYDLDHTTYGSSLGEDQVCEFLLNGTLSATQYSQEKRAESLIQKAGSEQVSQRNFETVSPHLGQNILFRIAREFHGYQGKNNLYELINYYQTDKDDALGLYYGKTGFSGRAEWKFNIDWGYDHTIDIEKINQLSMINNTDEAIETVISAFIPQYSRLLQGMAIAANPSNIAAILINQGDRGGLVTDTKSVDGHLNQKFFTRIRTIIKEEVEKKSTSYRAQVEKNIVTYIQDNSDNENAVRIPDHLAIQAIETGIGDFSDYFVHWDAGGIVLSGLPYNLTQLPEFATADYHISIETVSKVRNQLTNWEESAINNIDYMCNKLGVLRAEQGDFFGRKTHDTELDIPPEFNAIISEKTKEWNKLKESLFYTNNYYGSQKLKENFETYQNFFSVIYARLLQSAISGWFHNDVDDSPELLEIIGGAKNYGGLIEIDTEGVYTIQEGILSSDDTEFIDALISSDDKRQVGESEQTLSELLESDSENDRLLVQHYINMIIISLLQAQWYTHHSDQNPYSDNMVTLSEVDRSVKSYFDTWKKRFTAGGVSTVLQQTKQLVLPIQGLITSSIGGTHTQISARIFQTIYNEHRQNAHNFAAFEAPRNSFQAIEDDVKKTESLPVQIQQIFTTIQKLNKDIRETKSNIDWYGKRGEIIFDIETQTITSRGNTTALILDHDSQQGKIKGYDKSLSIDELVQTVNFVNRCKYWRQQNPDSVDYEFSSRGGNITINNGYLYNTTVLKSKTMRDKYPHLLNNGKVDTKFIDYLNKLSYEKNTQPSTPIT